MEIETIKAAKKPHCCSWCGTRIEVGESYKRYRHYEPEVGTAKMHPECLKAMHDAYNNGVLESGEEYWPEWPRGCYHDPVEKDCDRCRAA